MLDRQDLATRTPDELLDAIGQLNAIGSLVQRLLLEFVAAYDEQQSWDPDGARSMDEWLACELGLAHETAADIVRVARALPALPAIAQAYADGRMSWDQLRAMVRFATPEMDADLAERARTFPVSQLRRLASRARPVSPEQEREAHDRRRMRFSRVKNGRVLRFGGEMPWSEGAVVYKTFERMVEQSEPDPESGVYAPWEARCADALVELCSSKLASESDADRATVVVHVDASLLAGGDTGVAELEEDSIAAETARRLACDCRWQVVADGPDGLPVGIGRVNRQVPPWMVRVLRHRDGGCRFVGCNRRRWLHAHHIAHWVDGGPTDVDNLLQLCGFHHRLLHEGGWRVVRGPDGTFRFFDPDGRERCQGPPPLREDVRRRFLGEDDPLEPPPEALPA